MFFHNTCIFRTYIKSIKRPGKSAPPPRRIYFLKDTDRPTNAARRALEEGCAADGEVWPCAFSAVPQPPVKASSVLSLVYTRKTRVLRGAGRRATHLGLRTHVQNLWSFQPPQNSPSQVRGRWIRGQGCLHPSRTPPSGAPRPRSVTPPCPQQATGAPGKCSETRGLCKAAPLERKELGRKTDFSPAGTREHLS